MNIRSFTVAVLLSAVPMSVRAGTRQISLTQGDFVSARAVSRNGNTLIRAKLSKSGRAKFKKLNQDSVNQPVHAKIGGVTSDFTMKSQIQGNGLEMGPFSDDDAQILVDAINRR
ncbi:MAG: hypothetical protein JST80_03200 [Bdellovibrionales bacterium]|nr:hypothetical protein [Bdellovibrionales bacterium]